MAKLEHYYTKFEEHKFYHVYNRTVDKQPMFRSDENSRFFLRRYYKYLSPVADTYAYCLLGNHFHILLCVRDLSLFRKSNARLIDKPACDIISHQFRKFFQSYAMAFNRQHTRIGTLFQTPFKRALVESDEYFTGLIYYIHANPQQHGLIDDFRKWKWSSYNEMLSNRSGRLKKDEVMDWFGNKKHYQEYHAERYSALIKNNPSDLDIMIDS